MVKKKIPTKHRSFDNVLEEVEMFFRARRKILAPGMLRDVLVRIGLPQAKKIVSQEDLEAAHIAKDTMKTEAKPETEAVSEEETVEPETPAVDEAPATFVENPELDIPGVTVLDGEDFTDIADALNAVESMSDSFMAAKSKAAITPESKPIPQVKEEQPEAEKAGLKIDITGSDVITAASTTFASTPATPAPDEATELEDVDIELEEEEATPVESELRLEAEVAEEPPEAGEADLERAESEEIEVETEVEPEITEVEEIEPEIAVELDSEEALEEEPVSDTEVETPAVESAAQITPSHVVKPLVQSKILILGENGVGKQSLMTKAELEPVESEDAPDAVPYIHTKIVETENHRVKVSVWSFDEAVKSKISRKDFYDEAGALIIVYAASDRWSFDSIDFWLKEATITADLVPPIVLVANKTDLVDNIDEELGESPVAQEEGFALAEQLAKKFSVESKLHPVAFIGTSCLTGEGVFDVFVTAAELAAREFD
ncbi:MAG: ADP-ribosylation factor-like protein [Candidatus Thorarchaeota archaeon]